MEISSATSVGCIRSLNEDSFFVSEPDSKGTVLAIVADGMGGHNAGEVASKKAVGILQKDILEKEDESPKNILLSAVYEANREIYELSVSGEGLSGMGTTMSFLLPEKQEGTNEENNH